MASIRDIQTRIKSVNSTKQITNAMNLVSTAKLQKAKARTQNTRPFFYKIQQTIVSVVQNSEELETPYLKARPVKKSAYIVLASDRGLCGGYNSNVTKTALQSMQGKENVNLITVGKKAKDFFKRRNYTVDESFVGISENPQYRDALKIGEMILDLYMKEEIDEVYLVYTAFKSTIQHEPVAMKLLPVDVEQLERAEEIEKGSIMNYEPSSQAVLDYIIPKYVSSVIYGGMIESAASEQGARMTAMDSATENAEEMISNLTLQYNRARQAVITNELSELVAGAEALK